MYQELEESTEAFEFARTLYYDNEQISKFRFYLLTDAYNKQRTKNIKDGEVAGKKVELNVWDINRIFDVVSSKTQKESVEQPELISSNAVCVRADKEKTIRTDYPAELSSIFEGKLFSSTNMVDDVNAWVNEHTKGMIEQIVDDSAANMLACLLNAIAFEADWAEKYEEDDIYEDDFTNADGSESEVSYLHSTEEIFVENEFFKGFIKPYKNEEFSFMALLPKKKKSPSFLLRAIKAIDFSKLYEESVDMTVYAAMPEFKYDFSKDLTGLCQKLGIHEVFTNAADFSNMSSADLKADSILHKAHIEVDRKGTKAAAVTSMVVVAGCAPMEREYEEVCLDRPFVYAIMNNKTVTIS